MRFLLLYCNTMTTALSIVCMQITVHQMKFALTVPSFYVILFPNSMMIRLNGMRRFEGVLLCTDLDGTLLASDHTVSKENLDAIDYFMAEGGIFTFITGRMPYFVAAIYQRVRTNAPIGCINGGGLYDFRTGSYLWTQKLSHNVLELVRYADEHIPGIGIQVNTFDTLYFCTENEAMRDFRRITGLPNITCHYADVTEPIAKIVFADKNEENIRRLEALLNAHPHAHAYDFIRSEATLYEILPRGIHKGIALTQLASILHIPQAKTIAVGDYNNDIGMLQSAGLGIAVANATPETKAAADMLTVTNDEHAIARIIADLEQGNLPFQS